MEQAMKFPQERIPRHIAFIMDGNGRWAEMRGKPRSDGHFAGTQAVIRTVENTFRAGVEFITLYAFSSENWNRPQAEIDALMGLMLKFLTEHESVFVKNRIRLRTIGDLSAFPKTVQEAIERVKKQTESFGERSVVVALNYGSRTEILQAAARYAEAVKNGKFSADTPPDWENFSQFFWTADIPDPDLIIRTSGESRLSNFLLLQGAYAELYFTETLWPDFDKKDLEQALQFFASRERRFGKTSAQIRAPQP